MNKIFSFKDLDDHYYFVFCGISLNFKHKCHFKYKKASEYGLTQEKRNPQLIVSLTSYPARINSVHKTINTLLTQSLKADKIILWLANEQFPNLEADLPKELLDLKELGLTIKWCEDLKSYKKLVPALIEYPEDIIVTADDDVYYQPNTLKILYEAYLKNPANIYSRRTVKLQINNGVLEGVSARKDGFKYLKEASYFNQLMGGGGCLYPPHSLYKDCTNVEKIRNTIPSHDDAYFWSMAILNKTKIQAVGGFDESLHFVEGTQEVGLMYVNKDGQSGISLENAYKVMIKEYPEILEILEQKYNARTN